MIIYNNVIENELIEIIANILLPYLFIKKYFEIYMFEIKNLIKLRLDENIIHIMKEIIVYDKICENKINNINEIQHNKHMLINILIKTVLNKKYYNKLLIAKRIYINEINLALMLSKIKDNSNSNKLEKLLNEYKTLEHITNIMIIELKLTNINYVLTLNNG